MQVIQPGPDTFLELSDTPSSYSAQALKVVRVKNTVDGLEFAAGGGGGTTLTEETPTGTVDGVNGTFTVTHDPTFIVIDGALKVSGQGYTYSAPTITVDASAPPVQYIRSFYAA